MEAAAEEARQSTGRRYVARHVHVEHSSYRGVYWRHGSWKARAKQNGCDLHLGSFDSEMEAARAYDRKAREVHGDKVTHTGCGMWAPACPIHLPPAHSSAPSHLG